MTTSTPTKVVGLGAGGHARVLLDTLRRLGTYEVVGLLDVSQALWHTHVAGVPVLGGDDLLPDLCDQGVHHVFIGIGSVGMIESRMRLYEMALGLKCRMVRAIHPSATVSERLVSAKAASSACF